MSSTTPNLSASRLRTSTPVKAITTTLATRSSPPIPPPSERYESIVKSILRHRFISNILLYSWVATWACVFTWTGYMQGGYSKLGLNGILYLPISLWNFWSTLLVWTTGVLPAILLRKALLSATRTGASSPSDTLKVALVKKNTSRAFATYVISSLMIAYSYALLSHANELSVSGDPRLSLFVKSRKHPYYLNGRLIFLFVSQFTVASIYLVRTTMLDSFVFRWTTALQSYQRLPGQRFIPFGELTKTVIVSVVISLLTVPTSAVIFGLARLLLPIIYQLPLLSTLLRPFTAHFLRGSWSVLLPFYHFPLFLRAWFLAFTTVFAWDISALLFDTVVTQPITISPLVPEPTVVLISGTSSSDKTFQYFAFSELKALASSEEPAHSAQRTALFGDQKYNPSLWSRLVRESLLILGRDYQLLLRRGKPEPPPSATPAPQPVAPKTPFPATPQRILRTNIYQKTKESPIRTVVDSFASDGSFVKALDEGAEAASLPELFKSVEQAVLPASAKAEVAKNVEEVQGLVAKLRKNWWSMVVDCAGRVAPASISGPLGVWAKWWTEERTGRVVEACLPMRELDVVVIEVLSHLICASLKEDRYGIVQRDIPKALEAFLSFLSAIEDYRASVNSLYRPSEVDKQLSPQELEALENTRQEVERANEVLGFVSDGLKDGVARIVRTFGDKLLAFKFPPKTANKLQGFLDYC
ncbi:hypothetical protein BDN72DRAFT_844963 [Pluteus cervinus]|uniref:Uncharacterized protein n=1 Tax=Pluteus cervinus TaxID=181527 RepID=A0ACD3ALY0_9AGAR|nr:hypothetical protein BDN72DRAFT_844963 [Pluteus cervinus]